MLGVSTTSELPKTEYHPAWDLTTLQEAKLPTDQDTSTPKVSLYNRLCTVAGEIGGRVQHFFSKLLEKGAVVAQEAPSRRKDTDTKDSGKSLDEVRSVDCASAQKVEHSIQAELDKASKNSNVKNLLIAGIAILGGIVLTGAVLTAFIMSGPIGIVFVAIGVTTGVLVGIYNCCKQQQQRNLAATFGPTMQP